MNFKVGQRVRIIRSIYGNLGKEAVVIGPSRCAKAIRDCAVVEYHGYPIEIDGVSRDSTGLPYVAPADWLAPLTPPAADTWAADKVKQLVKPIHQEPAIARDNAVCW